MDRVQKKLAFNFFTVVLLTVLFVLVMTHFKAVVIKREAMHGMNELGKYVLDYRSKMGFLPSESGIENIVGELSGRARMGKLQYRAQWIGYGAGPDTIVAYSKLTFKSLLVKSGYAVLTLDGQAHFWRPNKFEEVISHQQKQAEVDELKKVFTKPPGELE